MFTMTKMVCCRILKFDADFSDIVRRLYHHNIRSSFLFELFFKNTYAELLLEKHNVLDHIEIMEEIVRPTLEYLRHSLKNVLNGKSSLDDVV